MAPLQIASFCGIFLLIVCHLGDSSNPLASTKGNETRVDAGSSANAAKEKGKSHKNSSEVRFTGGAEKWDDDDTYTSTMKFEGDSSNSKSQRERKDDSGKFAGSKRRLDDDQSVCADDITRLCPEIPMGNNFALLVCLQEKAKEDDLTVECHHMLWEYKQTFAKDPKFEKAVQQRFCVADLKLLPDCQKPGQIVPCLLEHRQKLTVPTCKHMMTKMQAIVFSNFHLISHFLDDCANDVKTFTCGRIPREDEGEDIHSQNDVLECLGEHREKLSQACQKQIYYLAELSSDDYRLDRPLYYACKDDRERFCEEIPSGEGRVYKCLKKYKFEAAMSNECRHRLTERQRLEAIDPKANYPLMKNCMLFYQQYKDQYECERGNASPGVLHNNLLCLQKAIQDDQKVSGKCQAELFDLSQQLMEDYSINPEIVAKCDVEIQKRCNKGEKKEGKTIDCLMDLAEENEGKDDIIRPQCFKAIDKLLEVTGAWSDYRIDSTLYQACEPVILTVCKDKYKKEADAMIFSCLRENLHTDNMIPECEEQLLHLDFFVARNFGLDPVLKKACQNDVKTICNVPSLDDQDLYPSSLIISCLYRQAVLDIQTKVSPKCAAHVQRVMHQRAVDVHLMPEIQTACVQDLAKHCSEQLGKGEEIQCLQEKFNDLTTKCHDVISTFTEEEGKDYKLDRTLVRACSGMVTKFCEDIVTHGNTEGVLPCLVEHKNDQGMDEKCHAAIEHWQLVEMKNFKFSPQFKKACQEDAKRHCRDSKSKHDLIVCLSKAIHDAVIQEKEHSISDKCRKQLRVEKEEESEDILFDPVMLTSCIKDIKAFCNDVTYGQAKVLECLKENEFKLSPKCKDTLFKREEEEMQDPELDYKLRRSCKKMIKMFCDDVKPSEIFSCLRTNKNDPNMEEGCRDMIIKRQIRQSKDFKLDPQLVKSCKRDVPKFCKDVNPGEGKMVECLKQHYERLSDECMAYVKRLMREAARDYRMDARLSKECADDIGKFCSDIPPSGVEECLKLHLGSIASQRCRVEIVRQMREGRTDVQSDPLLYRACAVDVKRHCSDIPFGRGKVMKCLLEAHESNPARFDRECLLHLSSRMKMWELAAKVAPPETIGDLALAISSSPSKNYFFVIFATCLALIFVGGLVFGRLSKRIRKEVKDR
ncbi:Golgi apparatus protein 1-like isoform X2 [Orbicella faveolata]|uniref:Golgi apparatus protein 1-like isoform X2 n=1 Tax=Orbicella faveolata TaxID=48498 RepID=UPI0009E2797F|nr:Golgi apparatus protein 1-like isoform X2 [Orbicella faveolata]